MYLMHVPVGTSCKNMEHFAQAVSSGDFKKFDYGYLGNLIMYGSLHPPEYQLSNIQVPVVLFSGDVDPLADMYDVEWLVGQLPNLEHHYKYERYGHLDFIMGLDANTNVYQEIIKR